MRDLLLALAVFGSLPFILWRPYIGILVFAWLGYMNPQGFSWSFAQSIPFSLIVALTTLTGLLFSRERKRIPWSGTIVILLFFILWMNLTTFFAMVPADAWPEWARTMKIQLMTFACILLIGARDRLTALVWVIVGSLGFYGVKGGIFSILTGGQYMVLGPPNSFFEGNTGIGLVLIMILPLMRFLYSDTKDKRVRAGLLIAMLLTAVAIFATYSRGALVGGVAMGLFLWLKSPRKLISGIVIILSLVLIIGFLPGKWATKMSTIETYQQDASAMGRINAWGFAYNLAKDRPLIGGGFNTFSPELFLKYAPDPNNFHDAHSIYFEVLGEHGFVGFVLFLLLGTAAWRTGTWIIRRTRNDPGLIWARNLASMVQVSLVGYATGGAFLGLAYFDLYYNLIAILVITRAIVDQDLSTKQNILEPSKKLYATN